MIGDLHCHTLLSDGSTGIEDLVFSAKRGGMDFVAITDHDTMAGVNRAEVVGKRHGIRVIAGVELSAADMERDGKKVHILCYLPKKPQRILSLCTKVLQNRNKVAVEMIKKVMCYYPVTEEQVIRCAHGSQAIYKTHIMQALMNLGYTDRVYSELYKTLFSSKDGSCFVPSEYPDVRQVINVVRSAGGVAVMAHPCEFGGNFDLIEELGREKLLDGVELHHPRANAEGKRCIEGMASRYDLICTGGSDFHGSNASPPNPIGTCVADGGNIARLFDCAKSKGI